MSRLRRLNAAMDERIGTQSFLKEAADHIFPDNWSFMLGESAFYCFVLLVLSGVYLTMFFDPGDTIVTYTGSYAPLHGVSMSQAYESTLRLSLDVRGGLLFRQVHHWAANLFIAAILAHLARIFFTGAFRKPRDINWLVGVTMLLLSIFNGFSGYSLPGDLLSGGGLRIAYSISQSVPVIGNWLAYLFFGGRYPSDQVTHRLFIAHVLIAPVLIGGLLGVHLALIWRQKHTQFPGEGRSETDISGSQLWPTYAARSLGLFLAVAGVVALLAGLAQVNPIWLYGPYHPAAASAAAQPDWYVGWLEGALRLFPPWRLHLFGYTVSEVFWPAVFMPLGSFALLYAWPWLERWWTGDRVLHNLLDRPRERPGRTAFGVAALAFYGVLFVAGAQDVLASFLRVTQPPVTIALRTLVVTLPPVAGFVTWWICRDLQGGAPPAVEVPEGPASSATPPVARFIPARVRYERPSPAATGDGSRRRATTGDGSRRRATTATATAVVAAAAAVSLRARRRRRGGSDGR